MVHYIRFLKPPRLQKSHSAVRALITITNDLGDELYPAALDLEAALVSGVETHAQSHWSQEISWKAGMRVLWVEIPTRNASPELELHITEARSGKNKQCIAPIDLENMPSVVTCACKVVDPLRGPEGFGRSERRFLLQPGNYLRIEEDIGDSIARHIWDAGIVTVAFLVDLKQHSKDASDGSQLSRLINSPDTAKVLELGSGCGVAGIAVAQLQPRCQVYLTDLAEAMDVLNSNIIKSIPALGARISQVILDWEEDLPIEIRSVTFDLVLVSDCTYNSDYVPALVRTLSAIADISPNVIILISLKFRHPSEVILFKLLSAARFSESCHVSIMLPDRHRDATDQAQESVQLYQYQRIKKVADVPGDSVRKS